jgi:hypothetical protein
MTGGPADLIISAAACVLTSAPAVDATADGRLLIADVTSLDCIAPDRRAEIGALAIARLDGVATSLTRQALANLVRRRAPALTVALGGADNDAIAIRRERRTAAAAQALCAQALVSISTGEPISTANVATAACAASAPTSEALHYDRAANVTRARAPIAAGDDLGRLMVSPPLAADQGERLSLEVRLGAALIERTVEALQPSTGGAVFVRDGDGQVFSAPLIALVSP